jgi:DNA polymerase-3 subunit gamma/tau
VAKRAESPVEASAATPDAATTTGAEVQRTAGSPRAEITSLYRLHRPQRFADLVGQEHVTKALRHALVTERDTNEAEPDRATKGKAAKQVESDEAAKPAAPRGVGHAYLFSGPRGTGKTTTARLFAKALNCLHLADDGEPCGKCENCAGFSAQGITFPDLFEIDAASNNRVESIRDLIQRVNMGLGATSKKKVYLIDEVHMLSAGASNALLKTLEEPPGHVVFVLATTDPQKVLPTVRSRTQHFDFKLLEPKQLEALVATTLQRAGYPEADSAAAELIVRKAAGSGRDALSLLDQALALGRGKLDTDTIRTMLGTTDFDRLVATLQAIAAENPAAALVEAHDAFAAGSDVRRFADELLRVLRDAFVHKAAGGAVPYDGPGTDLDRLDALSEAFGLAGLTRGIEVLGETIADIRGQHVPDPRLLLEVAIVRLARRDTRASLEAIADRVERLEQRLASGTGGAAPDDVATPRPEPAVERAPRPSSPSRPARRGGSSTGEPAGKTESPEPPGPADTSVGVATSTDAAPAASATRPRAARSALGAHRREPPVASDMTPATTLALDTAAPSAGSEPPSPSPSALALDDVIVAWSAALGLMKPPVRAAVSDAQPIAVDGDVITFGVPRGPRAELMKKRFRDESGDVKRILSEQLGGVPRFKVVAHDFAAHDAFVDPGTRASASSDDVQPSEPDGIDLADDYVDPRDLVDAPADAGPVDATARLLEGFAGAQVVAERPR